MRTKFYIMRHSYPDIVTDKDYYTLPGPPLSKLGRRIAEEAAGHFPAKPDIIYTSRFARARQTAVIVSEKLDVPLHEMDELMEIGRRETVRDVGARLKAAISKFRPEDKLPLVVSHLAEIASLLATDRTLVDIDSEHDISIASIWAVDSDLHIENVWRPHIDDVYAEFRSNN